MNFIKKWWPELTDDEKSDFLNFLDASLRDDVPDNVYDDYRRRCLIILYACASQSLAEHTPKQLELPLDE